MGQEVIPSHPRLQYYHGAQTLTRGQFLS